MARRYRLPAVPDATPAQYKRAIERALQTYAPNKARLWPLKILVEYIEQEKTDGQA